MEWCQWLMASWMNIGVGWHHVRMIANMCSSSEGLSVIPDANETVAAGTFFQSQATTSKMSIRATMCRFEDMTSGCKPEYANQPGYPPSHNSWCYPKAMTEGISLHLDSFFPSISIKGFQSKFKITATVKSQSKTFRNVRNYIEYQQGLTSSTNWCARLKILLSCKISKKPFTSSTKHPWASSCLGLACWGKHFLSLFFPGRWKFLAHATVGSSLPPRIFFP